MEFEGHLVLPGTIFFRWTPQSQNHLFIFIYIYKRHKDDINIKPTRKFKTRKFKVKNKKTAILSVIIMSKCNLLSTCKERLEGNKPFDAVTTGSTIFFVGKDS